MSKPNPHSIWINPAINNWTAMRQRCLNPARKDFPRYGGRGIKVCPEWASFSQFIADVGERPSLKHQLDRFPNSEGNYEPGNVRWATPSEQARNRKSNRFYEVNGVRLCLKDWATRTGLNPTVVRYRIEHGWPIERALTTPAYGRRA
jgi:hypothetical protein